MSTSLASRIARDPRFLELSRKRGSFSIVLSVLMLSIYYGFIAIIAFAPKSLAVPLTAGSVTTIGFPLGIGVILSAIVLTGVYVVRANGEFDALTRKIIEDVK
ncbi:MAG: DUF485 domain-containing protein [Alphaproteobacteria bacterium]|nr:DUF485 domain-containing protein [Alphaproteobacteria bacterium]